MKPLVSRMFNIRKATLNDCRGIAEVQVDSYRSAYADFFPQSYLEHFTYEEEEQDWFSLLNANTGDILYVAATPDEGIVGYVLAQVKLDIHPGYDAEIVALHVRLTTRYKGLGRALLRAALQELDSLHCSSVMLWTLQGNPTRQWYEQLQGILLGEKHYQVEDWDIVEVAYGWKPISNLLQRLQSREAG